MKQIIKASISATSASDLGMLATMLSVSRALAAMTGIHGSTGMHEGAARITFEDIDTDDFEIARNVLLKFARERGWKVTVEVQHA